VQLLHLVPCCSLFWLLLACMQLQDQRQGRQPLVAALVLKAQGHSAQPAVLCAGGCVSHGTPPLPWVTWHGHTFNCPLPAESTIHYADVPWILAAEEPQQAELQRVVLYGGCFVWGWGAAA